MFGSGLQGLALQLSTFCICCCVKTSVHSVSRTHLHLAAAYEALHSIST